MIELSFIDYALLIGVAIIVIITVIKNKEYITSGLSDFFLALSLLVGNGYVGYILIYKIAWLMSEGLWMTMGAILLSIIVWFLIIVATVNFFEI